VGGCSLETSSFAELTRQVLALGVPVGAVLEGGYDLAALAGSVVATVEALRDGGEPRAYPMEAVTEQAIGLLGRWWPL
jgi:acetoin utilization deacetylase AcuC-like enzyme